MRIPRKVINYLAQVAAAYKDPAVLAAKRLSKATAKGTKATIKATHKAQKLAKKPQLIKMVPTFGQRVAPVGGAVGLGLGGFGLHKGIQYMDKAQEQMAELLNHPKDSAPKVLATVNRFAREHDSELLTALLGTLIGASAMGITKPKTKWSESDKHLDQREEGLEKKAGRPTELAGRLTAPLLVALLTAVASKKFEGTDGTIAPALVGAAAGGGTALVTERLAKILADSDPVRSEESQKRTNSSLEASIANLIIPGQAAYNWNHRNKLYGAKPVALRTMGQSLGDVFDYD